jgi:hypothetical protein
MSYQQPPSPQPMYQVPPPQYGQPGGGSLEAQKTAGDVDWTKGRVNLSGIGSGIVAVIFAGLDVGWAFWQASDLPDENTPIGKAKLDVLTALGMDMKGWIMALLLWRIMPIVAAVWIILFMAIKPLNKWMPLVTALPIFLWIVPHAYGLHVVLGFVAAAEKLGAKGGHLTPKAQIIGSLVFSIILSLAVYMAMSYNQHRLSFLRSSAFYHFCPPK